MRRRHGAAPIMGPAGCDGFIDHPLLEIAKFPGRRIRPLLDGREQQRVEFRMLRFDLAREFLIIRLQREGALFDKSSDDPDTRQRQQSPLRLHAIGQQRHPQHTGHHKAGRYEADPVGLPLPSHDGSESEFEDRRSHPFGGIEYDREMGAGIAGVFRRNSSGSRRGSGTGFGQPASQKRFSGDQQQRGEQ